MHSYVHRLSTAAVVVDLIDDRQEQQCTHSTLLLLGHRLTSRPVVHFVLIECSELAGRLAKYRTVPDGNTIL